MAFRLSSFAFIFAAGMGIPLLGQASLSHTGKIEVSLYRVQNSGAPKKIVTETGALRIDWSQKICDLKVRGVFAYCTVDTSQDLMTEKGELAVKAMPKIRFEQKEIDGLIKLLSGGSAAGKTSAAIELPFYECKECETDGTGVLNVYGKKSDSITREQTMGDTLIRFELHQVSPIIGAFNVIGTRGTQNGTDHAL